MKWRAVVGSILFLAVAVTTSFTFAQRGAPDWGFEGTPSPVLPAPYGALPAPARLIPSSPARAAVDGAPASFRLVLDRDPEQVSRAFLIYELAGLPDWTAAPRSINGRSPQGGFGAHAVPGALSNTSGATLQVEEIDPRWLARGLNEVRFLAVAEGGAPPASMTDLRAPQRLANLAVGSAVPYQVLGLRLAVVSDDERPLIRQAWETAPGPSAMAASLMDGDGGTGWSGENDAESRIPSTLDFPFRRPFRPTALGFTVEGRPAGRLVIEALASDGLSRTLGEVDLATLDEGAHRMLLDPAGGAAETLRLSWSPPEGNAGRITEIEVEGVPAAAASGPRLTVTSPRPDGAGLSEAGAILRGFVEPVANGPGSGRGELYVDGEYVAGGIGDDGAFELFVPRPDAGPSGGGAWTAHLEVVYPDGTRLEKTLFLGRAANDDETDEKKGNGDNANRVEKVAKAGEQTVVELDGVRLDIPPGAVAEDVTITIEGLSADQMADMDMGLTNLTAPFLCYRFGPDGYHFLQPVKITLDYDAARMPPGLTTDDLNLYFFDEPSGRWVALERLEVDPAAHTVTAWTDHFTDYISATLTVPDSPSGASFQPDSLQELETADPAAGIPLIDPPDASPTGDAALSFPLEVPPGRLGMAPSLAITYDSRGGDGWLGVGWDLSVPAVEVDTRFGVPRYDPDRETETYRLDGALLAPEAARAAPVARSAEKVFHRRVEGGFERIVRHGADPADSWWEVTDKDGVRSIFGRSAAARLADYQGAGNVFRWSLEQVIDPHGNSVDYHYVHDRKDPGTAGEDWVEIYLDRIDYTGVDGAGAHYHVTFYRDDGTEPEGCRDPRDPDGTPREDRLSTGLPGFKVYTRFRLACVDVSEGAALVRRYRLRYRTGDFAKSLLTEIALLGPDGTSELAHHGFDYFPMPADPDGGYDGFGPEEVWGRVASSKEATDSRDVELGAHAFAGIGPPEDCEPHGGIQVGGGGGESRGLLAFADVNGDGLPDRLQGADLFSDGGRVELNRFDRRTGQRGFDTSHMPGTGTLEHSSEFFFDFGTGGHFEADQVQLGITWLWRNTWDDRLLTDVNGDGFPDLVSTQGGFGVRLNDRGRGFDDSAPWAGFLVDGIDLGVPRQRDEVLENFPLSDTLRKLVLPYAGTVHLDGAIQKRQAGGDDGVRVALYHNGSRIWSRAFAPSDTSPCTPGPGDTCGSGLDLSVASGDRLYFLASSVSETSADALQWEPRVTYTGADQDAVEPYGAPVFVFDGGADFRIAGPPGGGWVAGAGGRVNVFGPLVKLPTADDVTASVAKNGAEIWARALAAGETGTFDEVPSVDVAAGDVLTFHLASDTQVDPLRVAWTPTVTYEGGTYCQPPLRPGDGETCGSVSCTPTPAPGEPECELSSDPEHLIPLQPEQVTRPAQVLTDVHRLQPIGTPTTAWQAPADGDYHVTVSWTGPPAGTRSAPVVLLVQTLHELVDKRVVAPAVPSTSYALDLHLAAGERVFFSAVAAVQGETGALSVQWVQDQDHSLALPTNLRFRRRALVTTQGCQVLTGECDVLSGGYHHWYYGEWDGRRKFNESALADRDSNRPKDYVAATPRWQGDEQLAEPLWEATGFDLYLAGEGVKPSRRGMNVVGTLAQAAPGSGVSTLRQGYARTTQAEASAFGLGGSLSQGLAATQIDFLDMNGDRFPDQVSEGHVRFSDGIGGFGPLETVPGLGTALPCSDGTELDDLDLAGSALDGILGVAGKLRCSKDGTIDATVGVGITYSKKDSEGEPKSVASTMPSVGTASSLSQSRVELMDLNGDGLPDRVSLVPGAEGATVQLNLGYRFGAPESWPLPHWEEARRCSDVLDFTPVLGLIGKLDEPDALSLTVSGAEHAGLAFGPIGGGIGTTLSRTVVEMVDVNGDGLADHVSKDPDERFFRVKINRGDGWGAEQIWHVPAWDASLAPTGDRLNPVGLFRCLDSVSFTGQVNGSASVGFPLCITIIPDYPILGIQIEVSVQGSGDDGGLRLAFQDLDGDGLPDHVLKKTGDSNVYVKRNRVGKTNLLRRVDRPLGGSFTLDYTEQGNRVDDSDPEHRVDMPENQWVLSSVAVEDGLAETAPYTTTFDYGNDAFYDRGERVEYGYARILETRPDGSTVERLFHNQDFTLRNLPAKTVIRNADGDLFRVQTASYEKRPVAAGSVFPATLGERTDFYEGTTRQEGGPPKSTLKTYDYDALGDVIRVTDFVDEGTGDDVLATFDYHVDPARYVVKPSRIEVRDASGHLLRRREAGYDTFGDLVRLEQTLSGGRDPETGAAYTGTHNPVWTFSHDALGNLASVTDPVGYRVDYSYDPVTRTHVAQATDSFGYVNRSTTDLRFGLPAETTDENGNRVTRVYDGFGRLAQVFVPYDTDGTPLLAFDYAPTTFPAFAIAHHKDVTRPDPIDTVTFVDGLERTLQVKQDAELDLGSGTATRVGMRVSGRVAFDALGRLAAQSQPVFDTGTETAFVATPEKNPTRISYDVLDRVTRVDFPHGGATRLDYGFGALDGTTRLLRTRADAEGRSTRFYQLVDGRVAGVEQTNTLRGARRKLVTRYTYNPVSELTAVRDPGSHLTSVEYDTLGQRVAVDSPDAGRTELRYGLGGDLGARITAELAARGEQIRYRYTFHRLDRIDYPEIPDAVFTYGPPGAPANRANRIATATDESGAEELFYGKLGETVRTVKTATALNGFSPKGPYTTSFSRDSFGRLLSMTYPDGEVLTYGYDAGGQLSSLSGTLRSVRYDYLLHQGYDEFGDTVRMVYGNGVETRRAYDPKSRFLDGIRTTLATGRKIQDLRYGRDLVGSLQTIDNDVPLPRPSEMGGPSHQSFRHDDLYQLVSAQGSYRFPPNKETTYDLELAYDEIGNVVHKSQTHLRLQKNGKAIVQKKTSYDWSYAYGGSGPHAATHIGERTYRYDRNGNQTGWDDDRSGRRRTVTWDEENRIAAVADNGRTTRFLYDAAGVRTNKAGPHGETIYVNSYFSIRNGAIGSKQVWADGVRIATEVAQPSLNGSPTGLGPVEDKRYFYHPDQLGSAHFVTDASGDVYQHLEYFPQGETWAAERSESQNTPYLFSGKEFDEETGLAYFGARYYEPRQGQWASADPIFDRMLDADRLAQTDPDIGPFHLEGLLYAYVANDPVDYTDPTGLILDKSVTSKVDKKGRPRRPAWRRKTIDTVYKRQTLKSGRVKSAVSTKTYLRNKRVVIGKKNPRKISIWALDHKIPYKYLLEAATKAKALITWDDMKKISNDPNNLRVITMSENSSHHYEPKPKKARIGAVKVLKANGFQ